MTRSASRTSAIALGVAAFVSVFPISVALADPSAEPAPTPSAASPSSEPTSTAEAPSLSEPAPTPGWAEAGPSSGKAAPHASARQITRHHAGWSAHRYGDNPVATVGTRVAGGVADLGSIAAYPFYCFPNYGSCGVRVPYRY
jgi:hypothetical protein